MEKLIYVICFVINLNVYARKYFLSSMYKYIEIIQNVFFYPFSILTLILPAFTRKFLHNWLNNYFLKFRFTNTNGKLINQKTFEILRKRIDYIIEIIYLHNTVCHKFKNLCKKEFPMIYRKFIDIVIYYSVYIQIYRCLNMYKYPLHMSL